VRLFASLFLLGCAITGATSADVFFMPVPVYGTPPNGVRHWFRITWQGGMNHPIVPAYFITEDRTAPVGSITRYVIMTLREYQKLARFTYSSKCSTEQVSSKPPYPATIEVDEFSGGQVRDICVFPRDSGCQYLFGLAGLGGIDWSHKDTWPLFQFEAELGCKGPLTRWHDASGRQR
jgi:hypothetical protein